MRTNASTSIVLVLCVAALWSHEAISQSQPAPNAAASQTAPRRDPYQRSLEIYEFKTTAKSGSQRGEELFYFKCSFCHNRYSKPELMREIVQAPPLEDLHRRQKPLRTGEPINESTLAMKIRNGGPAMAAYRYTLTEADLSDLVAYILSDKCCVDGENPPPNPLYRRTSPTSAAGHP